MSIDYSLFLLSRFREEVEGGATPDAAVATMMASAGHTVLVSGSTLTLCFLGLLLFPVEFLGMMGLGAAFSVGMCVRSTSRSRPPSSSRSPPSSPRSNAAASAASAAVPARAPARGRRRSSADAAAAAAAADDDDAPKAAAARKRRGCGCGWLSVAECTQRWGAVVIVAVVAAAAPFIAQVPQMTTTADFSAMVPRGATASVAFDSLIDDFGSGALAPYQLLLHPAPGAKLASQDFFRAGQPPPRYLHQPDRSVDGAAPSSTEATLGRRGHGLLRLLPEPHGSRRRPPPSASWRRRELSGLDGREHTAVRAVRVALVTHGCGGLNVSGAPGTAPLPLGDAGERRQYDDGAHAAATHRPLLPRGHPMARRLPRRHHRRPGRGRRRSTSERSRRSTSHAPSPSARRTSSMLRRR